MRFLAFCSTSLAENWEATSARTPLGNFPALRPFGASYRFGWSGLTAATGDVHFTKPSEDKFQLDGTGRTIGFVRALWKLDASYQAIASAESTAANRSPANRELSIKKIVTHLTFTNNGVTRARTEGKGAAEAKTRQFNFPNLFDLVSAMLYLRSQPLKERAIYRVVAYPATNAYLATVHSSWPGKNLSARWELQRNQTRFAAQADWQASPIGAAPEISCAPPSGCRMMPNDCCFALKRRVFVGTVFAELQSVSFENPQIAQTLASRRRPQVCVTLLRNPFTAGRRAGRRAPASARGIVKWLARLR